VSYRGPRRIVVTGSECTGKTTLARDLAARFGVSWVPEQSRAYAEAVSRELTVHDVEPIATAQLIAEDAGLADAYRRGDRCILLDTDLVSTVVYARHYYGTCPPWIVAEARARHADLYLLCDIDVPWEGDSVRDRPLAREELHELFRSTLVEFGARPCVVHGLGPERMVSAFACIASAMPSLSAR
jgi:NadR type nicotinamide-nucleotide adenylyltransferase